MYKPTGIIHLTGEPDRGILLTWSLGVGAGKTTLLKEWAYNLSTILWIRDDPKPLSFDTSLLGAYYNLETETRGMKRYEIGQWFIGLLDKHSNLNGIVVDTYHYIGECICAMVDKNPTDYRENISAKPEYKYPQIKGEGHIWHSKILARMAEQFIFVGLSTHSKSVYDNAGLPTGLYEPKAQPELIRAASDIWLVTRGDGAYCPTALVSKQGAKDIQTDRGHRTATILPEKLSPRDGDISLWDIYERYYNNPVSTREGELQPYEILDPVELSYTKGIMTPDQKRLYDIQLEIKLNEIKEDQELFNNQWTEAKAYALELAKGSPMPIKAMVASEIYNTFAEKYHQFTVEDVEAMIQ